ncbi:hypothetical protein [Erysipelothrix piscisicarius]|uniref:hypothetical protein n=1 Tax=Erysipelothrix piscisicarius TaxID=2485784 RepID=UPI002F953BEA
MNEVKDQLSLQALSQDVVDEGYIRLANAYQNLEEYKEENPTDKPIENPTDKPIEKPSERPNRKPETESLDHASNENYLPLTGVSSKFDSIFLVGLGMALIVINRRRE